MDRIDEIGTALRNTFPNTFIGQNPTTTTTKNIPYLIISELNNNVDLTADNKVLARARRVEIKLVSKVNESTINTLTTALDELGLLWNATTKGYDTDSQLWYYIYEFKLTHI